MQARKLIWPLGARSGWSPLERYKVTRHPLQRWLLTCGIEIEFSNCAKLGAPPGFVVFVAGCAAARTALEPLKVEPRERNLRGSLGIKPAESLSCDVL